MISRLQSLPTTCGVAFATFFLLGLILPNPDETASAGLLGATPPPLLLPKYQSARPVPKIVVTRDPFAIRMLTDNAADGPQAYVALSDSAMPVLTPNDRAAGAPLTDDPSTSDAAQTSTSEPHLIGVAIGMHPYVLIEDGAKSLLLTVGDRIDMKTIASITLSGAILSDGSSLEVETRP
ncbi:MAG TPA: hypothetical protein VGZ00_06655 [Candidatus Baltobacteraceae bacterium]|jgi:hypothetical protein|nr:hypothetical protein [Candidatus Baltobacteraceae bacterium]